MRNIGNIFEKIYKSVCSCVGSSGMVYSVRTLETLQLFGQLIRERARATAAMPVAKKVVIKKPSAKKAPVAKVAEKKVAMKKPSAKQAEKNDEAAKEKAGAKEGPDTKPMTPQQRHVFKRALELPPGIPGSAPADVREAWGQANHPKARAAIVNACVPRDSKYSGQPKFDEATLLKIRQVVELKKPPIRPRAFASPC